MIRRSTRAILIALVGSFLLTACVKPKSREEAVTARIEGYYAALVEQDFKKAYKFYSPGTRQRISFPVMEQRMKTVRYRSASVAALKCTESGTCQAEVKALIDWEGRSPDGRLPRMGEMHTIQPQKWVEQKGQWFLFTD